MVVKSIIRSGRVPTLIIEVISDASETKILRYFPRGFHPKYPRSWQLRKVWKSVLASSSRKAEEVENFFDVEWFLRRSVKCSTFTFWRVVMVPRHLLAIRPRPSRDNSTRRKIERRVDESCVMCLPLVSACDAFTLCYWWYLGRYWATRIMGNVGT